MSKHLPKHRAAVGDTSTLFDLPNVADCTCRTKAISCPRHDAKGYVEHYARHAGGRFPSITPFRINR